MANFFHRYFQLELIEARNKRMAARMIDLLVNRPDSYFFAFGAGHFLGKSSIIDYLEQAGFTVDHIGPGDHIDFRYYYFFTTLFPQNFPKSIFYPFSDIHPEKRLCREPLMTSRKTKRIAQCCSFSSTTSSWKSPAKRPNSRILCGPEHPPLLPQSRRPGSRSKTPWTKKPWKSPSKSGTD